MTTIDQQQAALLRAICQRPDDMQARLVYADWCEDNGQEARAEFVRVQCRISKGCKFNVCDGTGRNVVSPCPCALLRNREQKLLEAHGRWWVPPEVAKVSGYQHGSWPFSQPRGEPWLFRNGFVESITTTSTAWLAHGSQIVAATPVRTVILSDRKPQHYHRQDFDVWGWRSTSDGESYYLSPELWQIMAELYSGNVNGSWVDLNSRKAAFDALSAAAVVWARRQAGLDQEGVTT